VSWDERLDRPIELPNGHTLLTLEDARLYILQLSKSEVESIAWQVAIEALLIAAEKADARKPRPQASTAGRNSGRVLGTRKSPRDEGVSETSRAKSSFESS
jgi:hypothetical protein